MFEYVVLVLCILFVLLFGYCLIGGISMVVKDWEEFGLGAGFGVMGIIMSIPMLLLFIWPFISIIKVKIKELKFKNNSKLVAMGNRIQATIKMIDFIDYKYAKDVFWVVCDYVNEEENIINRYIYGGINMVKYCKNCGHEVEDDSVFCSECGFSFTAGTRHAFSSGSNPFSTYKISMIDGEEIIRSSQIHVGCLYPPLVLMVIGILMGFFSLINMVWLLGFYSPASVFIPFMNPLFIIGAIWFIVRYIGYKNNDLILTNKRVFGKCGLISTTQMQSPLSKVDSVSFSNGIVGKLIGYGTVEIATTSSHFKFRYIRDGQTLYNVIFNQLEISQKEKIEVQAKAIAEAIKNS